MTQGKQWQADGNRYEGAFVDDKYNGTGITLQPPYHPTNPPPPPPQSNKMFIIIIIIIAVCGFSFRCFVFVKKTFIRV